MKSLTRALFRHKRDVLFTNSLKCHYVLYKSNSTKTKICVVGAGPAGFYATQYMLKQLNDCEVDVIEKLPVPFGLVRYGVAPDHPDVKNVINSFSKTAENPRFRFLGNVALGADVSLQELRDNYHAVLLAYGADEDRRLNIANEDQPNVVSAREFVAWYNGFPGANRLVPDLDGNVATIIGQGNVAIDVARILLSPLDVLRKTDITEYALETLSRSQIEHVHLIGRRGPLQAAFTIKELREMLRLPNLQTIWRAEDFNGIREQIPSLSRPRKRLTELMLNSLEQHVVPQSKQKGTKQFRPIFFRAPNSIEKNNIEFTVTQLQNNSAIPTDKSEKFSTDLILRSIGYKSRCCDNGICFDQQHGHVLHKNGRVMQLPDLQTVDRGLYVTGWLGTGPTGVILTTMNSAFAVAKNICDDILSSQINTTTTKRGLPTQDRRIVSWSAWKKIDEAEIRAGAASGKPREKICDLEQMLKIAGV